MASTVGDPSTTTISTRSYYHVLQIDGYSTIFDTLADFSCIDSLPFDAGGYRWHINFNPKGSRPETADFIALFLLLADPVDDEAVTANITFSLLNPDLQDSASLYRRTGIAPVAFSKVNRECGYRKFIKRECFERSSKFLKDDRFAIRVDVHIVKRASSSMVVPPSDLHRHLHGLLSSKEGADVELRVGGEKFAAHRLVLGARSSVFKAALFHQTEEGSTSTNAVIQIQDMDARVFRVLLTFIYTDVLPDMDHQDEFAMTGRLIVAADRYNLQRLKLMCEDRLCGHIGTASVATILALAKKHHCPSLKQACFEFLGSFVALSKVIGTKQFEYLELSWPNVMNELICNVIARYEEKKQIVGCNNQEIHESVMLFR